MYLISVENSEYPHSKGNLTNVLLRSIPPPELGLCICCLKQSPENQMLNFLSAPKMDDKWVQHTSWWDAESKFCHLYRKICYFLSWEKTVEEMALNQLGITAVQAKAPSLREILSTIDTACVSRKKPTKKIWILRLVVKSASYKFWVIVQKAAHML